MRSATTQPRSPHYVPQRVPNCGIGNRPTVRLTAVLVSFMGSIAASAVLNGQEIDHHFVDLVGHMQPWPIEETEIPALAFRPIPTEAPTPNESASTQTAQTDAEPAQLKADGTSSIATEWRTTLTAQREATRPLDVSKPAGPDLAVGRGEVEVLVVPRAPADQSNRAIGPTPDRQPVPARPLPASQPRLCYQAPPLSVLSVSIALPTGKLPTNAAAMCASQIASTGDGRLAGAWAGTEFHWSASCLRHQPLYFEEINAERYGYTVSYFLQPILSAGHFFATIPALPYKMAVDRPCDCIYTLGQYRPGSCAPRRWNRWPWQLTAGVVETGVIAAVILLIP